MSSHFRILAFVAAVVAAISACHVSPALAKQTVVFCRQDTVLSNAVVNYVKALLTATDTSSVIMRGDAGLLSALATDVAEVNDEAKCWRASVAIALVDNVPDTTNLRAVLLVKAGTQRYVAYPGADSQGGDQYFVFDTLWTYVGTYAD